MFNRSEDTIPVETVARIIREAVADLSIDGLVVGGAVRRSSRSSGA